MTQHVLQRFLGRMIAPRPDGDPAWGPALVATPQSDEQLAELLYRARSLGTPLVAARHLRALDRAGLQCALPTEAVAYSLAASRAEAFDGASGVWTYGAARVEAGDIIPPVGFVRAPSHGLVGVTAANGVSVDGTEFFSARAMPGWGDGDVLPLIAGAGDTLGVTWSYRESLAPVRPEPPAHLRVQGWPAARALLLAILAEGLPVATIAVIAAGEPTVDLVVHVGGASRDRRDILMQTLWSLALETTGGHARVSDGPVPGADAILAHRQELLTAQGLAAELITVVDGLVARWSHRPVWVLETDAAGIGRLAVRGDLPYPWDPSLEEPARVAVELVVRASARAGWGAFVAATGLHDPGLAAEALYGADRPRVAAAQSSLDPDGLLNRAIPGFSAR
jgi:hypothetical protein